MQVEQSSSSRASPEVYTVWSRETPFRLTRSQIEFDSPNYFTSAFLSGQFAESASREIRTDKHPQLFALIVEHLSGYTILPLQPSALPSCMSVKAAHENLTRDAKYFGLDQLHRSLCPEAPVIPPIIFREAKANGILEFERLLEPAGDLRLVETPNSDRVEDLEGFYLWRARGVPITFSILEESDFERLEPLESLRLEMEFPSLRIRTTTPRATSSMLTTGAIDDRDIFTINGLALSACSLFSILQSKSRGDKSMPLPEELPSFCFETVPEIADISEAGSARDVIRLHAVADELVFAVRTPETDRHPCFQADYAYGKLTTLDRWKAREWDRTFKVSISARKALRPRASRR
ncbi:hypothetical protein JCM11491_005191 [Sporobolomyces phaffii]